ncbi:hypothetical protein KIM372_08430 [Bombiscardovia nodaiensis]|uniref:Uncharacterized protein n=1 Tax=Bombiscardovia nodaiensis TaxID=2932181 RepID=A0ABN6SCS8_9BIFI|nr:hypothetical protein KIM372_08430 [Bombiscardovia nodaiensis]
MSVLDNAKEAMKSAGDKISEAADSAKDKLEDVAESAKDKMSDVADKAKADAKVGEAKVEQGATEAKNQVKDKMGK